MRIFKNIPKINTVGFGGKWIAAGLVIGGVLPYVIWLTVHKVVWPLIITGAVILAAFVIIFAIEMHQDNSDIPYYEHDLKDTVPFDREKQYPVIKSSVCTGEKTAGFIDKSDGHFTEVMLIRSVQDEQRFREIYGIGDDTIKTIY